MRRLNKTSVKLLPVEYAPSSPMSMPTLRQRLPKKESDAVQRVMSLRRTCCRCLKRRAEQRPIVENQAVGLPREARAYMTRVVVIVANLVSKRKTASSAAVPT
jgi:hypothetical protein